MSSLGVVLHSIIHVVVVIAIVVVVSDVVIVLLAVGRSLPAVRRTNDRHQARDDAANQSRGCGHGVAWTMMP